MSAEVGRARRRVLLLAAALAAWLGVACAGSAEMTAADAREFTARALEEIGLGGVRVSPRVDAGVFRPESSADPVPVWETRAQVDGGTVTLFVARRGNRAVYLNDVSDRGGALLDDEQFRDLDGFRLDPAARRTRDRLVGPGLAAGALAAAAAAGVAALALTRPELARRARPFPP